MVPSAEKSSSEWSYLTPSSIPKNPHSESASMAYIYSMEHSDERKRESIQRILAAMEDRGLTANKLSGLIGAHRHYVRDLKRRLAGEMPLSAPKRETLKALSLVLGKSVEYLGAETDEDPGVRRDGIPSDSAQVVGNSASPARIEIDFDELQAVITIICEELQLRDARLGPADLGRYIRLIYEHVKLAQPSNENRGALVRSIINMSDLQLRAGNDAGPREG